MAKNDDKKNQTQNHPGNKGKGKSDDKQSTSGAGSQSGHHSSSAQGAKIGSLMNIIPRNSLMFGTAEDDVGQLGVGVVNRHTGQLARNKMCVSTFKGKSAITFTSDDRSALSEVLDVADQVKKPGQIFSGLITATDRKAFMDQNAKRKVIALEDEDERIEAGRAIKRARASLLQQKKNQQSSGEQGIRSQTQGDGQDQGRPLDKPQRQLFCVGCKSNKHRLDRCLKAGADGYMKGCPYCNTLKHSANNCRHPNLVRDKGKRIRQFVFNRRNMPSFLNFKTWFSLVKANIDPGDEAHFPWTPEFTKSNSARIEQWQDTLDTKGFKSAELPVDPSVMGWSAVVAHSQSVARDEKEKGLAEARAKVNPLSDRQKAAATMLGSSLLPDLQVATPEQVKEDVEMAGNAPVESPPLPEEQSAAAARVEDESDVAPVLEQEPVVVENESDLFAIAKEQHDVSHGRRWDEDDEDEEQESDSDIDGDEDDDEDDDEGDMALKLLQKREAETEVTKMAIRAKSHASEL
ncbi:hypothetical protein BFJ68_g5191 [Fusarium oxysporum]|uniref:Uncharacterized protein n=1 Tax=Fusarium oxysporum TaxID=5507 RepID=A0A420Q9B5_FUSOX|nr:hypothetical protein BFJ71_g5192 [Fusarium oxysporum]RKL16576.1 hypothetical protein BFJ68_g5191 [Fusarium oxysporum]